MKYKLPVRTQRRLKDGPLPRRLKGDPKMGPSSLPHSYLKRDIYGTNVPCAAWKGSLYGCKCGPPYDVTDGYEVCLQCGWVGGSEFIVPPTWHGTHTVIEKHFYNPTNYMKIRLKQVGKGIPAWCMNNIMNVFPLVYDTFKNYCPERKNMICYGFVITKLLEKMGVDPSAFSIKKIVTPSKIKENMAIWNVIERNCDLYI